jgi:pyridoxal/pyridoxine/pyridoxamine kinase
MSLTTSSKATAAEVIEQLREFEGIGDIVCTGVTESVDDDGNTTDSFQVSMSYVEETADETVEESTEQN